MILEKTTGRAYQELNDMIGLSSAKQVINQVLDSYKAKKIFKSKGMPQDNYCRHMVFTGNPGTAKTTVARLFADIMKDNEILENSHDKRHIPYLIILVSRKATVYTCTIYSTYNKENLC